MFYFLVHEFEKSPRCNMRKRRDEERRSPRVRRSLEGDEVVERVPGRTRWTGFLNYRNV